ncbi:hypothetical protein M1L60_41380 [Actinoplanes sp. TRM 88003]|uniref:Lipoprotein n=1 Tax=Paractinoplanes aksuensis TaxID=2939490 RepID=A0ABT1E1N4_9ACTN|nr:hypothetical protein [Actinoplanes aksuensis]MCO8277051.1 hypothetical protein [Actinoplanes aksuensis]
MRRSATLATLTGLALGLSACSTPTPSPTPVAAAPTSSAASPASSSPGATATTETTKVDPVAATKQILAGERQALIHITEDDKDWSATYEGPIAIGPGTDDGARFRLVPSGGDGLFLIEALRAREEGGRWCVNADTRDEPVSLGTVKCAENEKTLFRVSATGKKDDQGRPTHWINNEKYGTVQVKNDGSALYIQEVGDGGSRGTFSFVDRGAVEG